MKEKAYVIGNTKIKIISSLTTEENIRELYDLCNELFKDKPQLFYSNEESKIKLNNINKHIVS